MRFSGSSPRPLAGGFLCQMTLGPYFGPYGLGLGPVVLKIGPGLSYCRGYRKVTLGPIGPIIEMREPPRRDITRLNPRLNPMPGSPQNLGLSASYKIGPIGPKEKFRSSNNDLSGKFWAWGRAQAGPTGQKIGPKARRPGQTARKQDQVSPNRELRVFGWLVAA